MIEPITFSVFMVPAGKARPRHMRNGHTYTPQATVKAEAQIAKEAKRHFAQPLIVPVAMRIEAYFPIPTSWSKKKREQALAGDIRPTVKPDSDNIAKLVLDALNGTAYPDDKSVIDLRVIKHYAAMPSIFVKVGEA